MFTVYKITNKTNQKLYIGSSIRVEKRWRDHINASQNPNHQCYNYPLYQAFRKYGIENFEFEIIKDDFDSVEEMQKYEKEMIILFDSCGDNGYNQTCETTNVGICSDNMKKYLNKIKQKCAKVDNDENIIEIYESYHEAARKNGLDGDERASAIRDVCKGKESSCLGNIFRDLDENNQVISKPIKNYKNKQPVIAIPLESPEDILYFESVSEAAQKMSADRSSISKCIAGNPRYSHVKNHIFRKIDNNGNIIINNIDIEAKIQEYNELNPLIKGERHTVPEWCQIYNITRQTVYKRKEEGMSIVEAITCPKRR